MPSFSAFGVFGAIRLTSSSVSIERSFLLDHTWRSLAMLGNSPAPTSSGVLLALDSQLVLVGGQLGRDQRIHVAEVREGVSVHFLEGRYK